MASKEIEDLIKVLMNSGAKSVRVFDCKYEDFFEVKNVFVTEDTIDLVIDMEYKNASSNV